MFDDSRPIYRQIADQIQQDILDGVLQEEDQVMSTTQYAATFRINPATAAKAFSQLVDDGTLYKKRGLGMFVSLGARERLIAKRRERFFAEIFAPTVEEAERIGIPAEKLVDFLRRRELVEEDGKE